MGGGRWEVRGGSQIQAALRETAFSGRYKAQGRAASLHLLGTSGCMRLSETMDLEIVGQGGSEELKPESWPGVQLQASLQAACFQSVYAGACRGGRCSVRRLPTDMPKLKVFPGKAAAKELAAGWQAACPSQPPRFPSCL